mmetsp:Transcript_7397/g.20279  ORF Transcript_7397/g.20279 Transcript_7397/m.20279 type:complete len:149 (-) Transcript_7397:70-516(-)
MVSTRYTTCVMWLFMCVVQVTGIKTMLMDVPANANVVMEEIDARGRATSFREKVGVELESFENQTLHPLDILIPLNEATLGASGSCSTILGMTRLTWAILCDIVAIIVVLMCVPLLLTVSRRRPPNSSVFDCGGSSRLPSPSGSGPSY